MCYQYLKIQLISIPKILLCCLSFSFRFAFFCLPLLFHLFDGSFVRLVALSRSLWLFFLFVTCLKHSIYYYNYSTFCGFVFFLDFERKSRAGGERASSLHTGTHSRTLTVCCCFCFHIWSRAATAIRN